MTGIESGRKYRTRDGSVAHVQVQSSDANGVPLWKGMVEGSGSVWWDGAGKEQRGYARYDIIVGENEDGESGGGHE